MSKAVLKRLVVKGAVSYTAAILLILTAAMPAIAVMAANSVDSAAIINGQVKTRDIAKRAVTAKKINAGAVRSRQIKNRSVRSVDIASVADSKISYSTKTRHFSVSADTFVAAAETFKYTRWLGLLILSEPTAPGFYSFAAPVHLPDGAKITNVRFNYIDNDNTPSMSFYLLRRPLMAGVSDNVAFAGPTTGVSSAWRNLDDNAIENPVVDNANYFYYALIAFSEGGANMIAGGIVITYEVTGP